MKQINNAYSTTQEYTLLANSRMLASTVKRQTATNVCFWPEINKLF